MKVIGARLRPGGGPGGTEPCYECEGARSCWACEQGRTGELRCNLCGGDGLCVACGGRGELPRGTFDYHVEMGWQRPRG